MPSVYLYKKRRTAVTVILFSLCLLSPVWFLFFLFSFWERERKKIEVVGSDVMCLMIHPCWFSLILWQTYREGRCFPPTSLQQTKALQTRDACMSQSVWPRDDLPPSCKEDTEEHWQISIHTLHSQESGFIIINMIYYIILIKSLCFDLWKMFNLTLFLGNVNLDSLYLRVKKTASTKVS